MCEYCSELDLLYLSLTKWRLLNRRVDPVALSHGDQVGDFQLLLLEILLFTEFRSILIGFCTNLSFFTNFA